MLARVVDVFTRKSSFARLARLGEERRRRLAAALEASTQKTDAATVLAAAGHPADALPLAIAGLETLASSLPDYVAGLAGPPAGAGVDTAAALRAAGMRPKRVARFEKIRDAARRAKLPALDREVDRAHEDLLRDVVAVHDEIARRVGGASATRTRLWISRVLRVAAVVLVLTAAVVAVFLATRPRVGVFASASATYGDEDQYDAANVIDGKRDTWWLLPDRSPGWVEVEIGPPVTIRRLRILNPPNPPHDDRSTLRYEIELHLRGRLVRRLPGTLAFSAHPDYSVVQLPSPVEVDRIRLVVKSWHRLGGGLAELDWR